MTPLEVRLYTTLDNLLGYFSSTNGVPVERATIKFDSKEVQQALRALADFKAAVDQENRDRNGPRY